MNLRLKKLIVSSVIFILVFNLTGFIVSPPKAQAQLIVECPLCSKYWQQIVSFAKDYGYYIWEGYKWLEEKLGWSLADLIAKRIMDYIVDQTVQWIAGGGKPKFISNWEGFLKTAGDIAFDTVVKKVGAARICEPFSFNVQVSLIPLPIFSTQIDCTLDKVVSNIKNFYSDFRQGGWLAYEESWYPANNFYGLQLKIADEMLLESARKAQAAQNEAMAGKGFISVKRCVEWNNEGYQMCVASGLLESECKKASCTKEEIITPGAAVGAAIENAIGSDTLWAANIRSWTAALVDALINRLIKEGILGMKSLLAGGGSSGGNEASAYVPSGYQNLVTKEIEGQKQQTTNGIQGFLNENQYILSDKNKSLSLAQQTLSALESLKSRNCAVSNAEIQSARDQVNRLIAETANLNSSITELNTTMNKIRQAASAEALAAANQDALQIFNKYNTVDFQAQIIAGSARQAADQEAQDKQAALNNAQSRLSACAPSAPATTSTQP